MNESLSLSNEELKRVDHLIFVTMKYTRTVDVLRNILDRMITSLSHMLDALIKHKGANVPNTPAKKTILTRELYVSDKTVIEIVDFYVLLRKIVNTQFEPHNEYRRHVGMSVKIDNCVHDITIDKVEELYHKLKEYFNYVKALRE